MQRKEKGGEGRRGRERESDRGGEREREGEHFKRKSKLQKLVHIFYHSSAKRLVSAIAFHYHHLP